MEPTCDETRALEQRLTRAAITQSETDTLNNSANYVGYSRPLELSDTMDIVEFTDRTLRAWSTDALSQF